jgi:hypothetical protein
MVYSTAATKKQNITFGSIRGVPGHYHTRFELSDRMGIVIIPAIADHPRFQSDDEAGTDAEWEAFDKGAFTLDQFKAISAHLLSTGKASA